MARRRYVIAYDITDDKRREAVFQTLLDHGDHAQYSVFFCELNARELAELRGRLRERINQREDQILIVDLGPARKPLRGGLECLGKAYEPSIRTVVI